MKSTDRIMAGIFAAVLLAAALPVSAQDSEPVRAPDALPGTTPAMRNPSFWIGRIADPDRVIMTPARIEAFNQKNARRTIPADHPYAENVRRIEADGPRFNVTDPLELPDVVEGTMVTGRLDTWETRLLDKTLYDRWALPLTEAKKAEILASADAAAVPDSIRTRPGMIVRHTTARLYPVDEPGYMLRGYLDDHSITSLDAGMPVMVLHESADASYYFVMAPVAWGWVPARDIGLGSREDISDYRARDDFVIATVHRVPFYNDSEFTAHAGHLYLGGRLACENVSSHGYRILYPVRERNGSLGFIRGWMKPDAAVNRGYLPYTQRNVIEVAFSILDRPYGWHDSWDERDCGGIMRVIFNCFGFTLPRYWSFEQLCSDRATFVGDIESVEEKNARLADMPPGITFTGTTGHIGLYLGTVDGIPYAIHQCGWNYKLDGAEYKMARVVVSDYINIGFNMSGIKFFTPVAP